MNLRKTTSFVLAFMLMGAWQAGAQDIQVITAQQLKDKYAAYQGVVVVNFWSTWCLPCIEEIPHFLEVMEKLKEQNVALWLISQDTPETLQSGDLKTFIAKKAWQKGPRHFWFNETNADEYCPVIDPGWSGVIPATFVINPAKKHFALYEGALTKAELEAAIQKAL